MVNELLALKAEAEHEMLYAKAKLEVVEKLLAKVTVAPVEQEIEVVAEEEPEFNEEGSDDAELNEV